jgi:glycosyltransferase involved in cell wall biosynthesis
VLPGLRRAIHPWRDLQSYRQIRQTLATFRPDVVHTHSAKGGILGRAAAASLNVPAVIHTVHGAPFYPYQPRGVRWFYRRCERWAAPRCHAMISVADAMTDLMVDAGVAPREKFTTIYSGMDVQPFLNADEHRQQVRQELGFDDHHVVIGKIARLFHLKGHDDVIQAAIPLVRDHPQVRFLFVGDGILRQQLQQRIAEAHLTEYFHFTGLVSQERIPPLLGAMDAVVHTSLREGLARALPQALIAGKPVISYDVDGAREVVLPEETGFLIRPRDVDALGRAFAAVIEDPTLRDRLGQEGRRRFTDRFRHETMTREIRSLYCQVLQGAAETRDTSHAS